MQNNIIIDEEFESLLPALDEETYAELEENIIANGCRDALILWNGILIDGHNRHQICTRHNIPYTTINREFESREDVLIWIISNQVSRRNLTQMQLSFYRGLHYKANKKIVANAKGKNQHSEVSRQNDDQPQKRTVNRLSEQYRVSPKTIERDAKLSDAINAIGEISPEAKRKILSGEADVNKRALENLASKPKEEIESFVAEIEDGTYKRRSSDTPALGQIDNLASSVSAELKRLDALINNTMKAFNSRLRKLSEYGGLEEYKTALRSYINSLEEMYKSIPD